MNPYYPKLSMHHLGQHTLHNQFHQAFAEIKQVDMKYLLLHMSPHTNHKVQRIRLEDRW